VKKYHPNGNVKSNKEFDDEGKLHGKMEEWYANGHVHALPVP
jgi:antitoxin component YwqK of YwqJK toxin-antitoxin module